MKQATPCLTEVLHYLGHFSLQPSVLSWVHALNSNFMFIRELYLFLETVWEVSKSTLLSTAEKRTVSPCKGRSYDLHKEKQTLQIMSGMKLHSKEINWIANIVSTILAFEEVSIQNNVGVIRSITCKSLAKRKS